MIGNGIPVNTQTGMQSVRQADWTLYRQAAAQSDGRTGEHTPADADEHPLAQFVGGVGEDDGRVEVTTFTKHPEEVGHVEIVVRRSHHPAPHLRWRGSRHKVSGLCRVTSLLRRSRDRQPALTWFLSVTA